MKALGPYRLVNVRDAPDAPGVYAWYATPRIYDRDVRELEQALATAEDGAQRKALSESFLRKFLYGPFREAEYSVKVWGKLKAEYAGKIPHTSSPSDSLCEAVAQDPQKVRELAEVLQESTPIFSSPIYIGMASSLRRRLVQHKKLISKCLEVGAAPEFDSSDVSPEAKRDHSFAWEAVVQREISPSCLSVFCLKAELPNLSVFELENVLNRLYYPLCGRN